MHTKYYNEENKEIPSVTTILKVLNKPALVGWANSLGFKRINFNKELNRTAEVGTLVHSLIEDKFNKKLFRDLRRVNNYDDNSAGEILNSYFAFKSWYDEYSDILHVVESEKMIEGEYYGGTIDMIAKIDGVNYIIDFKTSSKVHPTMFLQLAAYSRLASDKGYSIDKVAILRLDKKTGKYQFVTMSKHKIERYFLVFMMLLKVYEEWKSIGSEDWDMKDIFS